MGRKVDVEQLVALGDISKMLDAPPATIHSYFDRRASNGFPEAVVETSAGRLWLRGDIETWAQKRNSAPPRGGRKRILPTQAGQPTPVGV